MKILDACCGSRMFWYDKHEPHTTYMDMRKSYEQLADGHIIDVNPDVQGDFRDMDFEDNTFDLVVFDPPHLIYAGATSWLAKKYGVLPNTWQMTLVRGFDECRRVLKPSGVLIMKWNEEQIKTTEMLKAIESRPIFGDRRSKTRWLVFLKEEMK